MNLDPALLDIVVCPDCRGALAVDETAGELVCTSCGLAYPVRDDIPVLLVVEAGLVEPGHHLEGPGRQSGRRASSTSRTGMSSRTG